MCTMCIWAFYRVHFENLKSAVITHNGNQENSKTEDHQICSLMSRDVIDEMKTGDKQRSTENL